VLASDIPALRETGEGVARYVPAGAASAWASAIRELAADSEARKRMSASGIARAGEYRYERYAERVEALLVELVQARRGAAA
jgi:glycosyltransferase involved in cell wall biosynthesis